MDNNKSPVWTTEGRVNGTPTGGPRPSEQNGKSGFHNPFLVAVQSKFRRKYYHKAVFLALILVILILIIAIIAIACKVHNVMNVCESKECLRAASNLLQTMDLTADPCEDFYQFTCGNWGEEYPRPDSSTSHDWFSERQARIMRSIRKFLQTNESSTEAGAVIKAKKMFKACINTEEMDELGVTPILTYLKEYKLPPIPSYLNRTDASNETSNSFDWVESLVNIKRSMGMDVIIGFDIFADPTNRTMNRIAIGTPETGAALPFNDDTHYIRLRKAKHKMVSEESTEDSENEKEESTTSTALTAYLSYIRKVMAVMIVATEPEANVEEMVDSLNSAAVEIVRITKFIYKLNEDAENATKGQQNPLEDIENVSIEELQKQTDEPISPKNVTIWKKYVNMMLDGIPGAEFNIDSGLIITSKTDIKYLQAISTFVAETPMSHIELFIWWSIIEELIIHTTSDLRRLHNEYTRSVIKTEGSQSRSLYCSGGINTMMGLAVSHAIIDEKFLTETRPKVETMLSNIQRSFNAFVKATSWMDEQTKVHTLEKSGSIKSFIGFPEWILNKTELDEHYGEVEVNVSTHLDNMMGILKWKMKKKLKTLNKVNEYEWATTPTNVNAFYTFQANRITVPIAILQFPFYELGLEALNYGAIGTILGHELTHGFDDSGRMFDKSGNMRQWWTNSTINEYINRTSCFIKQYSKYYLTDINEYIDGELSLGENIADNGGLREAYYAYKLLVKTIGKEKLLPGLEKYTHEQLLFISFGNLWCESYTAAGLRYAAEDSHCPGRIRLQGVLSNSPEFSSTFDCKPGAGMYPKEDRCRIW